MSIVSSNFKLVQLLISVYIVELFPSLAHCFLPCFPINYKWHHCDLIFITFNFAFHCAFRDECSSECSRMSEDSEDSQCCDSPLNTSCPTSPSSPCHDYQRVSPARASTSNLHPHLTCSHPRQHSTDSDGIRFPLSPNDVCYGGDLRRTALLRSVQMIAHPVAYELPFGRDLSSEKVEC